ncbi:uncharacterized protein LOC135822330 [Sycon ciliatum]|uniref:uncharacterized protein LOC135822330 n=1 Tax=Sycon ciliatum TaxID=27933 RepID=UPI0031F5FB07
MSLQSSLDQEAECFRVLTASSHFEVLQLEKTAVDGDVVRKQYRKIALRVHPDKNHSPDAEQAFKAVSLAYDCLSSEDSQQDYLDELIHGTSTSSHSHSQSDHPKKKSKSHGSSFNHGAYTRKWWEQKSWEEVEKELKKQEEAWKEQVAHEVAEYQMRKERKSAYRKRRHARVHNKLAPLYAKYGLMDEFSERKDELKQDAKEASAAVYASTHDETRQAGQVQAHGAGRHGREEKAASLMICASADSSEAATSLSVSRHGGSAAASSGSHTATSTVTDRGQHSTASTGTSSRSEHEQQQPVICTLCNRKFRDDNHLQDHVRFSQLHQTNLDNYMQQSHSATAGT